MDRPAAPVYPSRGGFRMTTYDYRTVPAPRVGLRARGVRSPEARFALAVEAEMNRMSADGWEYVRSDTLPSDEKQGLFGGRVTVFRTLLVFRRARPEEVEVEPERAAPIEASVPRAPPLVAPLPVATPMAPLPPLVAAPPEAPPVPGRPARAAPAPRGGVSQARSSARA
jgi:hypothetical protein